MRLCVLLCQRAEKCVSVVICAQCHHAISDCSLFLPYSVLSLTRHIQHNTHHTTTILQVWDIMRAHCKRHPPHDSKSKKLSPAVGRILGKECGIQADFTPAKVNLNE